MASPAPQPRSRWASRPARFAEAAVERARLTVVPHRRTRAPRIPFVTLVSVILLGGVVGLLLFNTSMQQASFAATSLEEQATSLSAREQSLQMELERLRDPQRVAEAARRQGLVESSSPAFLDLDTGEVTGQPAAATPANATRITAPPPTRPPELDPDPVKKQRQRAGGQGDDDREQRR
jgi:cell division protein FtsB